MNSGLIRARVKSPELEAQKKYGKMIRLATLIYYDIENWLIFEPRTNGPYPGNRIDSVYLAL